MNTTRSSLRTRPTRWGLLLVLAVTLGLVGLSPARADAAPLAGTTQLATNGPFNCVVTTGAQVRCWGSGGSGQIGNGDFADRPFATLVDNVADTGPLAGATQVAVGESHACARLSNSRVVCWGENGAGQLGNGSNFDKARPVVVRNTADTGPLTGVTQIAAGDTHTCARLSNGQGVCWGADDQGQLGEDGAVGTPAFVPVGIASITGSGRLNGIAQLTAGTRHTCALLAGRQVRCWGANGGGQVGDGTDETRPFPVAVESVNGVTALTDVTQISAGSSHTCARLSNGQARCWGEGDKGELGDTTGNDRNRPGIVRAPTGTAALTGVAQVSAGGFHTCFRLTNGQVRCTGSNARGQLGNPSFDESFRPVVVRAAGNTGPLGNVAQLAAGGLHTCARLVSGQVRCWGHGGDLELGNNSLLDRELPVVVRIS